MAESVDAPDLKSGTLGCTGSSPVPRTIKINEGWREHIIRVIRTDEDMGLRQAWYSLDHVPGFYGIRSQVGRLVALMRADWRRSRSGPFPFGRALLPYARRLPTQARTHGTLLADLARTHEL